MSWMQAREPECSRETGTRAIATIISGRPRDIGFFSVRRVLPSRAKRLVGPFIFFDHMGPANLAPGRGMDVLPHPHLNLATVTYLFDGGILHRDSLGSEQLIVPGDVNWMTAGRGIVHSERTPLELRREGTTLDGIQLWVALPTEHEETEPAFDHYAGDHLPRLSQDGVSLRVLAGAAYGAASPVKTLSRLFYVDAAMPARSSITLPDDHPERAAYVASGNIRCGSQALETGQMGVFLPGGVVLHAETESRVLLLGGGALDGERHIWWNFVSSSKARLDEAKEEWRSWSTVPARGPRFDKVPGDEDEFVPLPSR